jgi:hypothetical protein
MPQFMVCSMSVVVDGIDGSRRSIDGRRLPPAFSGIHCIQADSNSDGGFGCFFSGNSSDENPGGLRRNSSDAPLSSNPYPDGCSWTPLRTSLPRVAVPRIAPHLLICSVQLVIDDVQCSDALPQRAFLQRGLIDRSDGDLRDGDECERIVEMPQDRMQVGKC